MATGATAAIAAAVARARRDVHEHFEGAGALDPARAVAYEPPDHIHQRQFELMVGSGVLQPTGDGRYWLNLEAERLVEERRRAAAVLMLKIVGVVAALAIAAVAILRSLH